MSKTVLFQAILFSISTCLVLSDASTLSQSAPWHDVSKGILCIPQSSGITAAYASDRLVLYPGHSLGKSYPSVEMQSVYSAAPTDWTTRD